MQQLKPFLDQIRALIARNDLDAALSQLQVFLGNSSLLDEVLQQSGRWNDIRQQIRLGMVKHADALLTSNQIRAALLDLLQEIGHSIGGVSNPADATALRSEVERAISVVSSQNVNTGQATAGRDMQFGNRYETHHHYDEPRIPRVLTPMPYLPEVFLGREDDLQRIHDIFASGDFLLLVNGEGGVGKTSVASKYFHQYQDEYTHVAWVLSEKSIAGALLLLALPLGVQFEDRMDTNARLDVLLRKMANLNKPCLLVVDNANELDDLEAYYPRLRQCTNFHLLLTTRIREFGHADTYPIEGLPEKEALEMFQRHYQVLSPDERALFMQIRKAVGSNTLVLELFAKNLARVNRLNKKRYTLADLLADLQQKGLLQLSQTQQVHTEYQGRGEMRREKPEDIIGAMYDLGELPAEEIGLLSVFAVLPAESIPFSLLKMSLLRIDESNEQFLEMVQQAMDKMEERLFSLAQKGWIGFTEAGDGMASESSGDFKSSPDLQGEAHFKCSQVVQEVVRRKNPDLYSACENLVWVLIEKLSYELGSGHPTNVSYKEALYFARYAESVVLSVPQIHYDTGLLCKRIANYYVTIGDLEKGFFFFQKSIQIDEALCIIYPENLLFKSGLATSYCKLGETHIALGNLENALTFFTCFNQLIEGLCKSYPENVTFKNNLAISYERLGSIHSALGNREHTLTFFENNRLSSIQSGLKNWEQALTYFEQCNQLEKELYRLYPQNVEFKNNLALSYSKLGSTHRALGNLEQALTFFEDETCLLEELHAANPKNLSFKNGLAVSYERLGSLYSVFGNLERALIFFKDEVRLLEDLYTSYPQNVLFKNNLAISYQCIGLFYEQEFQDLNIANDNYLLSKKLLSELVDSFPAYVEFRANLESVNNKLEA